MAVPCQTLQFSPEAKYYACTSEEKNRVRVGRAGVEDPAWARKHKPPCRLLSWLKTSVPHSVRLVISTAVRPDQSSREVLRRDCQKKMTSTEMEGRCLSPISWCSGWLTNEVAAIQRNVIAGFSLELSLVRWSDSAHVNQWHNYIITILPGIQRQRSMYHIAHSIPSTL